MNKEIMLFNSLYNNMKRQWKIGESDDVILENAFSIYQKEQNMTFKFYELWNLLKGNKNVKIKKQSTSTSIMAQNSQELSNPITLHRMLV